MRGSMLSLSTNGDNMSLSSNQSQTATQHLATMPRRHGSTASSISKHQQRNVHRSQSTHSKRSPMPSLQENTKNEVDYVNTTDLIEEELEENRPKSVAEISQKENVCSIKIVKKSASTVSKKPSMEKASKILGVPENNFANHDSGRFSMGSSLSPANEKKPIKSEDKAKFKSLGDLHMEKGLPTVLVTQ